MPLEARLLTGLALSLALVYWATPLAIRVAHRFDFYDRPVGYKGHAAPTPYLGGAAVIAGFLAAMLVLTSDAERTIPFVLGVLVLWFVGTVDDRRHLSPGYRIAVEGAIGVGFWALGLGWSLGLGAGIDLAVTCLWLIAVVNAFNLFDNLDGAASTMALVVSGAVAVLGLVYGDAWITVTAAALCGACLGFLPHNLALPGARIFLGDGGSMPVGFAVGTLVMFGASTAAAEWQALVMGVLLVGVPAADTILVVVTRRRRGISILTGGRDHLTHHTLERVRTARAVAIALGTGQALLSAFALIVVNGGSLLMVTAIALYLAGLVTTITVLDAPPGAALDAADDDTVAESVVPRSKLPLIAAGLIPLGIALALSPFASGYYDAEVWAPAGLVLLLLLAAALVARRPSLTGPGAIAVAALAGLAIWALLSATWADSIEQAALEADRLAVYAVLLGLLLVFVRGRQSSIAILGAFSAGALVVAGAVIAGLLDGDQAMFLSGRLHEPLEYVNAQGNFFLLAFWPALALAEGRRSPVLSGFGMAGATLFAAMCLLSQSRGVVLAGVVSVVAVMAFVPGRRRRAYALLVMVACLAPAVPTLHEVYSQGSSGDIAADVLRDAGLATLLASWVAGMGWFIVAYAAQAFPASAPTGGQIRRAASIGLAVLACVGVVAGLAAAGDVHRYVDRQYDAFVSLGGAGGEPTSSRLASGAGNRYDYWRIAGRTWRDHKLAGVGAGGYDAPYFRQRTTTEDIRQPHSLEMQTLAELGIIGLLLLVALLVAVAAGAWRHIAQARRSPAAIPIVTAALGIAVAWVVHTSVDWIHLLPGLTGMALAAAAVLLSPVGGGRPTRRQPPSSRPGARQIAIVALVALPLTAAALSLSRQTLADHYRGKAQDALAVHPGDALEAANRSLRFDSESMPTYYVKAAALARFGEGVAAEQVLREAARREPKDFVTWALLGDIAVRRGALRRAQRYYSRASDLNPTDTDLAALVHDPRARTNGTLDP